MVYLTLHIVKINIFFYIENTCIHQVSGCSVKSGNNMGPDARKPVFGGLRATKTQTSLRIRAVKYHI